MKPLKLIADTQNQLKSDPIVACCTLNLVIVNTFFQSRLEKSTIARSCHATQAYSATKNRKRHRRIRPDRRVGDKVAYAVSFKPQRKASLVIWPRRRYTSICSRNILSDQCRRNGREFLVSPIYFCAAFSFCFRTFCSPPRRSFEFFAVSPYWYVRCYLRPGIYPRYFPTFVRPFWPGHMLRGLCSLVLLCVHFSGRSFCSPRQNASA